MSNSDKYDKALKLLPYAASAGSFARYIADSETNRKELFQLIQTCKIDQVKCRFNVWRLTLGIIGFEGSLANRIDQINQSRESFRVKKTEAFSGAVGVKKQKNIPKNPLMKAMMKTPNIEETSDEFLRDEIRKDIERTYQQMKFFQDQNIIKLLSNVLFIWCKRNPQVSYKQGMNQVLASIVYVYFMEVYTEGRNPQLLSQMDEELKKAYILFNNIEHAEADIYCILEKVMNVQQEMYRTEADSSLKGVINPNSKNNTPILQRIITITDHKLKTLDMELFRAIKLQDVQTKTFLLRWIRCMHTREFSLQNSFLIWDSLFLDYYECPGTKEKSQFEFIDAMCLAMFIYMRTMALTRETAYEIQQIYQKYPQLKKGGYLQELISLAWTLCDALRQSTNVSNNDWFGEESVKVNNKLQFVGNKDSPGVRAYQKQQQHKLEQQKEAMKKAADQAKDFEKKQNQIFVRKPDPSPYPQSNNRSSYNPLQSQNKPEEAIVTGQQVIVEQADFPIILQSRQWKQLQDHLKTSLSSNKDAESRKHLLVALQILDQKIIQTTKKHQA